MRDYFFNLFIFLNLNFLCIRPAVEATAYEEGTLLWSKYHSNYGIFNRGLGVLKSRFQMKYNDFFNEILTLKFLNDGFFDTILKKAVQDRDLIFFIKVRFKRLKFFDDPFFERALMICGQACGLAEADRELYRSFISSYSTFIKKAYERTGQVGGYARSPVGEFPSCGKKKIKEDPNDCSYENYLEVVAAFRLAQRK